MNSSLNKLLLIIILILGLSIRLIFFVGIYNGDDSLFYVNVGYRSIQNIRNNEPMYNPCEDYSSLRFMFYLPITFSFMLFGISNYSAALFPLLTSLGSIVLIFYICKIIFDEKVGLIASFLLSIFPYDVIFSTSIMPDIPLAFFMSFSVFFFLKAETSNKKRTKLFYFLSGIMIGISVWIKVLGIVLFFFYLIYLMYKKKINRDYTLIFLGFLIPLFLEGVYFYYIKSDFLFRYNVMNLDLGIESAEFVAPFSSLSKTLFCYYPKLMLNLDDVCFTEGTWFVRPFVKMGYVYFFVFIAILYLLTFRIKKSFFPIIWFLSLFIYLQIGPTNPINLLYGMYTGILKHHRALNILTTPALIILAFFLNKIHRFESIVICIFLMLSSLYLINYMHFNFIWGTYSNDWRDFRIGDIKSIHDFLSQLQERSEKNITDHLLKSSQSDNNSKNMNKDIYVMDAAIDFLDFYFGFKGNIKNLDSIKNPQEIHDAYVVLNLSYESSIEGEYRSSLPEFRRNPPENWKLVKIIPEKNNNYDREFNPIIYYAP